MILIGLIFLVVGWFIGLGILEMFGLIFIVTGFIFGLLAEHGRPVGGRNWWY